ncbi:MAG: hypothetical protein WBA00_09205 [Rhodococcus sp. (in: high G+C Gram-positive bacteria)]
MAQPHLGERTGYLLRLPDELCVEQLAHEKGYSAVSRFGADVFCDLAGRPDLKLGPEISLPLNAFPLPVTGRFRVSNKPRAHSVRVPAQIDAKQLARRHGYSSVARFGRDVFCDLAGRMDLRLGPDVRGEGGVELPLTA